MEIITLGSCCKKSRQNHENTVTAAKNCGIEREVLNLGDIKDIMKYGVLSTPAIVIDGKVVSYGKALTTEQIEKLINERKQ